MNLRNGIPFRSPIHLARPFLVGVLAVLISVGYSAGSSGTTFLLQTSLKLLSTAAAAKTVEELGKGMQKQWDQELAPGESLYAVKFSFQRATWSDFWSRPDIFLIVEREGGRRLVIPQVEYDWNYSDKLISFRCPTLEPGEKCILRVYDDDGVSDRVFKSLLQTELAIHATAKLGKGQPSQPKSALVGEVTAAGKIRLLQPQDAAVVVLDTPDAIAAAEFQVPQATNPWSMEGTFRHRATDYGKVSLTQVRTHPLPGFTRFLFTPRFLFWGILTFGLFAIVAGGAIRQRHRTELTPPLNPKDTHVSS